MSRFTHDLDVHLVDWKNDKRTSTNKQSADPELLIIIADDDDDDDNDDSIEIQEISSSTRHEDQDVTILPNLIPKLDQDTELIIVQPNSSIRICTSALTYSNLLNTHVILVNIQISLLRIARFSANFQRVNLCHLLFFLFPQVNHSVILSPECLPKRQLYLRKSHSICLIPIRTRIYQQSSSLLGFVFERPSIANHSRYLILFDDYTAAYDHQTDFHLCLCQNFPKHLSNIDYSQLRTYYQYVFEQSSRSNSTNWPIGTIVRVRKFGTQYHNARIIDRDCSIMKICFFERKSQAEMWIHSNSSMIDPTVHVPLAQTFPLSSSTLNSIEDLIISDGHFSRLRKRKSNVNNRLEGIVFSSSCL